MRARSARDRVKVGVPLPAPLGCRPLGRQPDLPLLRWWVLCAQSLPQRSRCPPVRRPARLRAGAFDGLPDAAICTTSRQAPDLPRAACLLDPYGIHARSILNTSG